MEEEGKMKETICPEGLEDGVATLYALVDEESGVLSTDNTTREAAEEERDADHWIAIVTVTLEKGGVPIATVEDNPPFDVTMDTLTKIENSCAGQLREML
jgi:hypothetical protein